MRTVFLIIFAFLLISGTSALNESLTFDEVVYLQEGRRNLISREFTEPYGPPLIKEIATIPEIIELNRFIPNQYPSLRAMPARLMILILTVVFLWSVYKFTDVDFGKSVALASLFFLIFDPSILAHSHYVTLDMGLTLFFWLSFVAGVRAFREPSMRNLFLLGLYMGLAAASKLTVWWLITGLIIATLLHPPAACAARRASRYMVLIVLIILGTIYATYGFTNQVVIEARKDDNRVSRRVSDWAKKNDLPAVNNLIDFLETQPIPLGGYFAIMKNSVIRGLQTTERGSFKLLTNWILKTSIPYLLMMIYGGLVMWKSKVWRYYVYLPIVLIFTLSIGGLPPFVRHLVPIAPFWAILGGVGVVELVKNGWRWVAVVLVLWLVGSVMGSSPHFLTYANELITTPEEKITRFSDSNQDWGQGLISFKKYLSDKGMEEINFSYFGRDDGGAYGLVSKERWGGYRIEDICRFHRIDTSFSRTVPEYVPEYAAISVTNWQMCGYKNEERFRVDKVKEIVGESILIF